MKPYVICHMCTSIDGKIMSNRWRHLVKKIPSDLFETTAASFGIGAWMVGTTTMREFSGKPQRLKKAPRVAAGDHVAQPKAKKFAIGIDAKAALRFQENEVDGDHTIVLITEQAGNDYRAHLQAAGVSYLICGRREVDLAIALEKLRTRFNIKKLMAQGGGKFNGSMLAAGLIDEVSHIVEPVIDGGYGVSGFFDITAKTNSGAAALKQISHRTLPNGVNWFRYKVVHSRAK